MAGNVRVKGPDGKVYAFPDGTTKDDAVSYFQAKDIGAERSAASPIMPTMTKSSVPVSPSVPRPQTKMEKVYTLTGEPQRPITDQLKEMAVETGKGLANVSAPVIAHRTLQQRGLVGGGDLYSGEVSAKDLPMEVAKQGTLAIAGGIGEGEGEAAPVRAGRKSTVPVPPRVAPLSTEQQAKYTEAIDKANRAHGEALAEHATKEAEARAKWVEKTHEAKSSVAKAEAARNKTATLERGSREYTRLAHDNLQQTYKAARGTLDRRWGVLRKGMEGAELDASKAFNQIEEAKAKYLKGSPASLLQFNNLAREMGIQEFMEGEGGALKAIPGAGELPFDTARVHYSAIGDKLAQGNLPGNVFQALKAVERGLDEQLTKAAGTRGMGEEYSSLKAGEHQFRSDWTDSKSPLAKAFKSQDPNYLHPQLQGKGADLLMKQLARYRQHGARPYLAAASRRMAQEAEAVPKPKVTARPGKYQPPSAPELKEVARPKPEPAKLGKGTKMAARVAGKVVGGTIGGAAGHPLLGYGIGGELGEDIAERIARRRSTLPPPP